MPERKPYAAVPVVDAGQAEQFDPLLQRLQTPKELREKNWEGVARIYFSTANFYARKNNRHIEELAEARREYHDWKTGQLERSTREYQRLQEEIKSRDAAIDQLKATIHLLTKVGR